MENRFIQIFTASKLFCFLSASSPAKSPVLLASFTILRLTERERVVAVHLSKSPMTPAQPFNSAGSATSWRLPRGHYGTIGKRYVTPLRVDWAEDDRLLSESERIGTDKEVSVLEFLAEFREVDAFLLLFGGSRCRHTIIVIRLRIDRFQFPH